MSNQDLSPWSDEQAQRFLSTFDSWFKMARLVQMTLNQDPQKYPHEIRAACSMIIMFGREGLWPEGRGEIMSVLDINSKARRQLAQVKHQFSIRARVKPELKQHPKFRKLLNSVDQEIKILENRIADPPVDLPQSPPDSWGKFWCE